MGLHSIQSCKRQEKPKKCNKKEDEMAKEKRKPKRKNKSIS